MKKTKAQKGITLIALIITIVILLILAVVAIRAIQGDGILQYAEKAASDYEKMQAEEEAMLQNYLETIEGKNSASDTEDDVDSALNHSGTIPEGGTYISYANVASVLCETCGTNCLFYAYNGYSCNCGSISLDNQTGIEYQAGENFPSVSMGDIYIYGDYKYRYNIPLSSEAYAYYSDYTYDGWGAKVLDNSKSSYEPLLVSINGESLVDLVGCFSGCKSLETAPAIPETVTSMYATFGGCSSLIEIPAIPDSVTALMETFNGCTSLTNLSNLVLPNCLTTMEATFSGCTSLTDLSDFDIPNSVTNMSETFWNCTSLIEPPVIPEGITRMYRTFGKCTSLTDLSDFKIPNSVTSMDTTFWMCSSLTIPPTIPSSVTSIHYAFAECTSLTDLSGFEIPSNVTDVSYTFYKCTSLTTAPTIPSSVTNMMHTFVSCTSLTGTIAIETDNITKTLGSGDGACTWCFNGTTEDIILTGSASDTVKALLASTANNGNVTY